MCCSACQRAEKAPGPSRSAATKLLLLKNPDVGALYVCLRAVAVSWPVARADELFGVQGMHVLDVATGEDGSVLLEVESDDVLRIAAKIASNSPTAVQSVKRAVRMGEGQPIEQAIAIMMEAHWRSAVHPDRIEGIGAFNDDREPTFQDPDY